MKNYADENMYSDKPDRYDYEDHSEFLDYVMQYNANQKYKKKLRSNPVEFEEQITILR